MSEETKTTTTTSEGAPELPSLHEPPPMPATVLGGANGSATGPDNPLAFNSENLPGELANEPSLRNFDSIDQLAKSYVHAVKKLGVPGEELVRVSSEGDKSEIYDKLGRPETPDGYQFEGNAPDHFKQAAHHIGLNQEQANLLANYLGQMGQADQKRMQGEYEQEQLNYQQEMQKEFGDNYIKNVELARRAFLQFGDNDTLKFLEQTGVGNHPGVVKAFAKIGTALSEDGTLMPGSSSEIGGMTPVTAEARINELKGDPEFMKEYNDAYHPKHVDAVKRMTELYNYLH